MLSAKYLDERRKLIGGSDVAAILGLSPFKTAYQIYQEKRKEVEDWQGNELTEWGSRMEPTIRQWYSDKTGRAVRVPDKIIISDKYPFMGASLDGFTDDSRGVEIKTARSGKGWGEPGTNEIPDYYAVQCHHYMIVTGFPVFDVPVSIMGGSPQLYEVPADKEIHEMIIDAEANFWQRVVDGNPPDPVTYADAVARFGKVKSDGSIIATDELLHSIQGLRNIREKIKEFEDVEETLRAKLIIALGDHADTLIDSSGNTLVTYKLSNGRKSFDGKRFEKEHPDLYQQYLKVGEPSRRLLIK